MALTNTSDDKFIAKPFNPNEKVKCERIYIIPIGTKDPNKYDMQGVPQERNPAYEEEGGEEWKWNPTGPPIFLGTCDTNFESSTFALDLHNKAIEFLGSHFKISNLTTANT